MKALIFLLIAIMFCGCQSAFHVPANQFPIKLKDQRTIALSSATGETHQLFELCAQHKATVAIFWQTTCPCVKRYQARINHLYKRYGQLGVKFFHIFSNTNEDFARVAAEYEKRMIPLPLLHDPQGRLAQAIQARGTPTAAVFNSRGELVFLGWIDNERDEKETGRIPYLEHALEELLHKDKVSVPTSPMFGCSIR